MLKDKYGKIDAEMIDVSSKLYALLIKELGGRAMLVNVIEGKNIKTQCLWLQDIMFRLNSIPRKRGTKC
jgi:hypothetical protein